MSSVVAYFNFCVVLKDSKKIVTSIVNVLFAAASSRPHQSAARAMETSWKMETWIQPR